MLPSSVNYYHFFLRKIAKTGSKFICTKPTCYQKRRNSIIHGFTLIFIPGVNVWKPRNTASFICILQDITTAAHLLIIISNLVRVFGFQNMRFCPLILGQLNSVDLMVCEVWQKMTFVFCVVLNTFDKSTYNSNSVVSKSSNFSIWLLN